MRPFSREEADELFDYIRDLPIQEGKESIALDILSILDIRPEELTKGAKHEND